jgi:hypothetical protein
MDDHDHISQKLEKNEVEIPVGDIENHYEEVKKQGEIDISTG